MRRKPLNHNVREGLRELASFVEAGGSADITGYEEEQMDAETLKEWRRVQQAVEWIKSLPD